MTLAEDIACATLHCGIDDLNMLDGIKYCLEELVDEAELSYLRVDMNSVLRALIARGLRSLYYGIQERIFELESEGDDGNNETIEALKKLNPIDDMESYLNCSDSYVWIEKNYDIYHKHLQYLLDIFEDNTGFYIE